MLHMSSTAKGTSLSLPEGISWAPYDAAPPAVPRLAGLHCINDDAGVHSDKPDGSGGRCLWPPLPQLAASVQPPRLWAAAALRAQAPRRAIVLAGLLPLGQRLAFVQGRVVDGVTVRTRRVKTLL